MIPRLIISAAFVLGLFVSATIAAPPGSAGARIFAFVDANGDNSIDSKEFDAFSASMQTWMVKHGMDGKKPIARVEFLTISGRMLREIRRTPPRIGVAAPKNAGVVTPANATPAVNGVAPETIEQTIAAGTAALPVEFQPGDFDRDGQIDFFEWRKFKKTEMARFYQLDVNKDYVLSLAELGGVPAVPAVGGSTTGGSGTTPATTPTGTQTASESPAAKRLSDLKYIIETLDKNNNKMIDPDEWAISKKIKPAFEKAKVDISKPMKPADFTVHYNRIFPVEAKKVEDTKTDKTKADKAEKRALKSKSGKRERKEVRRGFRR